MSFVDDARTGIEERLNEETEPELLDLLTMLLVTKGSTTTLDDVHLAWCVYAYRTDPDHPRLHPLGELDEDVAEANRPYLAAVIEAAGEVTTTEGVEGDGGEYPEAEPGSAEAGPSPTRPGGG